MTNIANERERKKIVFMACGILSKIICYNRSNVGEKGEEREGARGKSDGNQRKEDC